MKMKFRAAVGSLLVSGVLAGAAVMPAAGQAANPGDVCNTLWYWTVTDVWLTSTGGGILYHLAGGDGFRIVSYGANNTYYGHGSGKANGYIGREAINQSSCHA